MTMPSANNVQSDLPGFPWIFILESSKTSDKKPGEASTEDIVLLIMDEIDINNVLKSCKFFENKSELLL